MCDVIQEMVVEVFDNGFIYCQVFFMKEKGYRKKCFNMK